ncbi:hypothetical protein [Bacteroides acidifaciens]|uniref:hypothetical protein n=1 Tax=Bacteroides acidifaciens TaxID=85831 RepID=UPI00263B89E8|nr:hypothetical protein [Bacteroides acidifaciens]
MKYVRRAIEMIKMLIVLNVFQYTIRANMFGYVNIRIRHKKLKRIVNLNLFDNYTNRVVLNTPNSIKDAYREIDTTKHLYLHLVCYRSFGIYVELSDEFVLMKHNGELYAELAIPVKKYRKQLKTMLEHLMVSRELYYKNCMIDMKADMSGNSLVFSSRSNKIKIDLYHANRAISEEPMSNYYLLSRIPDVENWYTLTPLWTYRYNKDMSNSIILTARQVEENFKPPLKYFNSNLWKTA